MSGLLRKELRELRPFVLLVLFLIALDLVEWLFDQWDMQPLGKNIDESSEALAILMFFLAFATGTGLLVREIDNRTLVFLDGLPVSRVRVFGTKLLVTMAVLMLYPLEHLLLLVIQHQVSRQSLDHALHATILWKMAVMCSIVTLSGLALGMLLGYLRSLCWAVLGLLALLLHALVQINPRLEFLNPLALLELRLVGTQWHIPTVSVLFHLATAGTNLVLSLAIFTVVSGRLSVRLAAWSSRPLISAAIGVVTIGVCLGAVVVLAPGSDDQQSRDIATGDSLAIFTASPTVTRRTAHYSFTYRSTQAEQAQAVMKEADRVYGEVAALLVSPTGSRIDVDLTGSLKNTEGTAFHDRIRMQLGGDPLRTLAHETSHVLSTRLAGGEAERELSKMGVLNEGLATWVEVQVSGVDESAETRRLVAALVSKRRLVRPEELSNMEELTRRADVTLRYPLGEALVESLVARYGPGAPNKLLVTLANPDFPRDLENEELWSAAFQAAGYDLGITFDDYTRRLKQWESEREAQIAMLPRPRVDISTSPGQIRLGLRWDGSLPEGWGASLRMRPHEESSLDHYTTFQLPPGAFVSIKRSSLANEQICFQPGLHTQGATIFEAWSCMPIAPDP